NANGTISGAKLSAVSGDGQMLPTYLQSQPLIVRLADAQDRPIAGVTVRWSAPALVALSSTSSVTDSSGRASTTVTLQIPGSASVTAQTVGVTTSPVSFTLNGGVANISGLTPTEHAVAVAIDHACTALTLSKAPISSAEADLLARCTELVKNAGP